MENKRIICFIDEKNQKLCQIYDGEMIKMCFENGDTYYGLCKYIDDFHVEIDGVDWHICEFTKRMRELRIAYMPTH